MGPVVKVSGEEVHISFEQIVAAIEKAFASIGQVITTAGHAVMMAVHSAKKEIIVLYLGLERYAVMVLSKAHAFSSISQNYAGAMRMTHLLRSQERGDKDPIAGSII